ncbi:hypothetical protein K0M31_013462 [Melipona bicolor]|uniref:Uncharacterized protein n=1 Tax=Melipona bicolor TaxID=60889 RepID=A0AA40FHN5_9HYME|nr:hypothetical protein K0M31_013462 [Melipona bicolor]
MPGLAHGDTVVEAEGYIYVSSLDTESVKRSVHVSARSTSIRERKKKLVQWDYPEAGKCLAVEGKWLLDWYEPPRSYRDSRRRLAPPTLLNLAYSPYTIPARYDFFETSRFLLSLLATFYWRLLTDW